MTVSPAATSLRDIIAAVRKEDVRVGSPIEYYSSIMMIGFSASGSLHKHEDRINVLEGGAAAPYTALEELLIATASKLYCNDNTVSHDVGLALALETVADILDDHEDRICTLETAVYAPVCASIRLIVCKLRQQDNEVSNRQGYVQGFLLAADILDDQEDRIYNLEHP